MPQGLLPSRCQPDQAQRIATQRWCTKPRVAQLQQHTAVLGQLTCSKASPKTCQPEGVTDTSEGRHSAASTVSAPRNPQWCQANSHSFSKQSRFYAETCRHTAAVATNHSSTTGNKPLVCQANLWGQACVFVITSQVVHQEWSAPVHKEVGFRVRVYFT